MSKIKLPGSFSGYPNGPKPSSYAPHGQRHIDVAARVVRGAQRVVESLVHPTERSKQGPRFENRYAEASPRKLPTQPNLDPNRSKIRPSKMGQFGSPEKMPDDLDPYGSYYFALEINGVEIAHFQECSGLKNASQIFEIQEGGLNGTVHKRPGQSKWENLIFKYATSQSTWLVEWRDMWMRDMYAEGGSDKRQKRTASGSVAIISNQGKIVRRFHFVNAWPVSWEGPALNSTSSGLAIETLEIAHDGITVDDSAWNAESADTKVTLRVGAK